MDSNEKKSKRPRIGQPRLSPEDTEMKEFMARNQYEEAPRFRDRNSYQRPQGYNRQDGGYNNQGSYNNQGGYNRDYNRGDHSSSSSYERHSYRQNQGYQRRNYDNLPSAEGADSATTAGDDQQRPAYQTRQNQGYRRPYNNQNRQQGGYNNQNRQGGYNNNRQQGGYNNQNRQGSYQNRQQGGYNNQNRQGGYNNNRQQGGYNNQNRQGGYNNRQQGGYNNQNRRPGGRPGQQGGYNNGGGMSRPGKSFVPRPKRIEYEQVIPDPNEQIRLNKFMANSGICSRREADEFIQKGLVKVNGNVVTELGTKITHNDTVEYDEKVVALERKTYILLNKPKDCVTTADDPNGRLTVMDLVKGACDERIYPVGRLDRNTTGVLLLTNDGDLASKLTHPQYVKKKIYHVWTDKDISEDDMQAIADGIELEDGPIHADAISYATDTDRNQAGIEIHSGRNRIVRRIFESLGYHVTKLDRVYFAGLTKKNLPRGRWRYLTQEEVNFLKMGSFE